MKSEFRQNIFINAANCNFYTLFSLKPIKKIKQQSFCCAVLNNVEADIQSDSSKSLNLRHKILKYRLLYSDRARNDDYRSSRVNLLVATNSKRSLMVV